MKSFKTYFGLLFAAVVSATGFTACDEDFDAPELNVPVATLQANTTIAELKEQYWNSDDNYIDTVRLNQSDEHIVIKGRVISSDAAGNIYKSLVIQDETAALAMSINANSLYVQYRIGQEIVIDVTDMYIGKYSTLQQLGFPEYSAGYGWQATFMPLEFFKKQAQLNGLPKPEAIDTLTISLADLSNSSENLRRYQSQLVRLNNVFFEEGGEASFCTAHKENTNRTLKDDNGNSIIVRTSGYANYWSAKLPEGHGDVVGILSTYKSSGSTVWQLLMRDTDDLMNFGNPTLPKGTETNPYDVVDAIDMIASDKAVSAWYTGFIVGSLKAGVTTVSSDDDILWGADAEVNNTLVIGLTAETKTIGQCMLLRLPQDSPLRQYGNLRDIPENYLRQIWVLATPATELGMNALTGNTGAANEFRIEGVTVPGGDDPIAGSEIPTGDGSKASPYNPTQVIAMGTSANETDKWIKGYIVGWVDNSQQNYADEKNCNFTVPASVETNILIAATPDVKDYSKCVVVNLPTGDVRTALNLKSNPANLGKVVTLHGTVKKYFNIPGFRDTDKFELEGGSSDSGSGDGGNDKPAGSGIAAGDGSQTSPYNPAQIVTKGTSATENDKWLKGYIVGWIDNTVQNYGDANNCMFSVPATSATNILLATTPDVKDYTQCVAVNLPTGDVRTAINLKDNPANLGKVVLLHGNIKKYFNLPGFREADKFELEGGSDAGGDTGGGSTTPTPPSGDAIDVTSADLNTLVANSSYSTVSTTDGWLLTNCAVQSGTTGSDANPAFSFIGNDNVRAACLNGRTTTPGSLVSPLISGGIKTLSFNYGFAFGDSKCKFTINIKQNGAVVASKTVTIDSITKLTANSFSWNDVNVNGNFSMEIVNDCYSQSADKNKDRVSIWNISWTR